MYYHSFYILFQLICQEDINRTSVAIAT